MEPSWQNEEDILSNYHPTVSFLLNDFDEFERTFLRDDDHKFNNIDENGTSSSDHVRLEEKRAEIALALAGDDQNINGTTDVIIGGNVEEEYYEGLSATPLAACGGGGDGGALDENLCFDYDFLMGILQEEQRTTPIDYQVMDDDHGRSNAVTWDKPKIINGWTRRRRYKKGSVEELDRQLKVKIKNREAAFRSFQRKQAYIRNLELQVQVFKQDNALRQSVLMVLERSINIVDNKEQLRRTASGPF